MARSGFYGFSNSDSNWFAGSRSNLLTDDTSVTWDLIPYGTTKWIWVWGWNGPTIPVTATINRIYFKVRSYVTTSATWDPLSDYYRVYIGCRHLEYPTWQVYDTLAMDSDITGWNFLRSEGSPDGENVDGIPAWGSYSFADEAYWRSVANGTGEVTLQIKDITNTGADERFNIEYIEMDIDYDAPPSGSIQLGSFG